MEEVSRENTVAWDLEVDMVIAGAGAAGLAAAVEAAETGAEVVVYDKQAKLSDTSTVLSGGAISFGGTDYQKKQGIQDSGEAFQKEIMEVGQWKNDPKLVELYIKNQLDTYHWLTELGVKWQCVTMLGGMSVPRAHYTDPLELLAIMQKAAEKKGAKVYFETKITDLITDDHKNVIGVSVENKGKTKRVKARKGVILATGGFGRDTKKLESIDPRLLNVTPLVALGHTGDGHKMAEELGAYLIDMENVKPTFGIHVKGTSLKELVHLEYIGAIIVNKKGERYVKESMPYKDLAQAALDQPDGVGFEVFDQKIYDDAVKRAKALAPKHAVLGLEDRTIKLLVSGKTIRELATKMGVPPEVLERTINGYNSYADGGKDPDFGRSTLARDSGRIMKIDTSPFYAFEAKGSLPGTYGGIAIDADMHVLTKQGRISGLYAVGELIGGFHGTSYMSGT
ncbi:flavocytochrome c, partial [Chloroflexota bacterium]